MAHVDLRLFIKATPERVWSIISDLERQKDWMVDLRSTEFIPSAQPSPRGRGEERGGVGAVMKVTSELFGQPVVKDVMRITRWEPPHRFDVVHEGHFHGTGFFELKASPNGTVFVWVEDFNPPLGPLGELGFTMLIGPHLYRVFSRSMENVRRLAEEA
jgi:uncharacterized protein YndB with AHSA1/START domain